MPDAEKLAELQLDPIARLGIDKSLELPETVVYDKDGVKIIMEGSYYETYPALRIKFHMEGAPEFAEASVELKAINGQEIETGSWVKTRSTAHMADGYPDDEMVLELSEVQELMPEFTGIHSITVDGTYLPNYDDPFTYSEIGTVTCGTNL